MADLMINVDKGAIEPVYKQVYNQICQLIYEEKLAQGEILPAIRDLAKQLGIARNTVEAAYKQLALEGLAQGKKGTGYIVQDIDLTAWRRGRLDKGKLTDFSFLDSYRKPMGDSFGCTYDFSYGNRRVEDMPLSALRSCAKEAFKGELAPEAAVYIDPMGLMGLREQIVEHILAPRGITCSADQVILLPGTQIALGQIVMLYGAAERLVAMEEPGYDAAVDTFKRYECELTPIPVHHGDKALIKALRASGARFYFCTPSNQYPLGFVTSLPTRLKIVEWARDNDAYVIEDDNCYEYRYDGLGQVPPLQALDPERVIYMGTMSKAFTPAARVSYLVLPSGLLKRWVRKYETVVCALPWLDQRILELFIERGYWEKHIKLTVSSFKKRHDILVGAIEKYLGDNVVVLGADAGLHVLIGDKLHRRQSELVRLAKEQDVRVYETNHFMSSKGSLLESYVEVGFSSIDPELIDEGIRRLALAWYG